MSSSMPEPNPQLLGFIAFCRMTSYARLARDVSMTTNFADQFAMAQMGGAFVAAIEELETQAASQDLALASLTQPYVGLFDELEARTRPGDWWERVVKSYVLVGMLVDLELGLRPELGANGTPSAAQAIGHEAWVLERIGQALEADASLAARLSMWGRRVAGEVLGATQKILMANRGLLPQGIDHAGLLQQLTAGHARRMSALGLAP